MGFPTRRVWTIDVPAPVEAPPFGLPATEPERTAPEPAPAPDPVEEPA